MRKHGMFTPHGGNQAQQPQVKHDKRNPPSLGLIDKRLSSSQQSYHQDLK